MCFSRMYTYGFHRGKQLWGGTGTWIYFWQTKPLAWPGETFLNKSFQALIKNRGVYTLNLSSADCINRPLKGTMWSHQHHAWTFYKTWWKATITASPAVKGFSAMEKLSRQIQHLGRCWHWYKILRGYSRHTTWTRSLRVFILPSNCSNQL